MISGGRTDASSLYPWQRMILHLRLSSGKFYILWVEPAFCFRSALKV